MKDPIVADNEKILIPNIPPITENNKRLIPNPHNKGTIKFFKNFFIKYPFFFVLCL